MLIDSLERQLERRNQELQRFETVRQPLQNLEKLQEEIERLRKEKIQTLQKRLLVRLLNVDDKTGDLTYYDPAENLVVRIDSPQSADKLLARLEKDAAGREQYFQFYWRPNSAFPTRIT